MLTLCFQSPVRLRYFGLALWISMLSACGSPPSTPMQSISAPDPRLNQSTEPRRLLTNEPVSFGTGDCRTTRRSVYQRDGIIEIEIDRPAGCAFRKLALLVDGVLVEGPTPHTTGFTVVGTDRRYQWSKQSATITFRYEKPLGPADVNQAGRFGLIEPECQERSCLTQAGLELPRPSVARAVSPVAAIPANLPGAPPASAVMPERQDESSVCKPKADGTFTSANGIVWQICAIGERYENGRCSGAAQDLSWMNAIAAAKSNRFLGMRDWAVPSKEDFLKSFTYDCGLPLISHIEPRRHFAKQMFNGLIWTNTRVDEGRVALMDQGYVYGSTTVFFDTNKDSNRGDHFYSGVRTLLARNLPHDSRASFDAAFSFVSSCDAKCVMARQKRQAVADSESVARFRENWRNLGREIGMAMGYNSSGSSSSSSSSSSSTSSGKSGAQKTFVCTIYCNSSSGPRIEREFTGPDREAVARMIDENSHSICRGSGFAKSSSSKFNPSQCRAK